jgi:hypothetical protein
MESVLTVVAWLLGIVVIGGVFLLPSVGFCALLRQRCPACREMMHRGATKCPHCHTPQERQ